ncbi:phage integrase SAM-like domain-containing protein [Photobacterium damselae]|uniref:phage integrase SAM-like domain-containing protein n=1 Tax=Photobacterium damselae TaxID=38293 RepID=UPI0015A23D9A|nr:phage integrase SAM-like domain-containing protein [Photobacterium damselae]NVO59514.1 phage integrase SAM-like domain-containing protein [Photobacterium damselae subsp. damselae]
MTDKDNVPEYIETFRTVQAGRTTSERYSPILKETLTHFIHNSETNELHTIGTLERYKKTFPLFLTFLHCDDIQLKEIERHDVFCFIEHMKTSIAESTVHGHISRLKIVWVYAYSRAWISGENPFDKHILNTTKGCQKKQAFTKDELASLMPVIDKQLYSLQLFVRLGLYTGA